VPTISAGKWVESRAKDYPPSIAEKAAGLGTLIQKAFAKAYHQSVKIAFGTDAGVFPHGQNAHEFEYMVDAGMPAMEAATRNAADPIVVSSKVGSIQPGR
jgi:imidazolonepropionase-like amidohydrolase